MEQERRIFGLRLGEFIGLASGLPVAIVLLVLAKPLVTDVLDRILHLPPVLVYEVVTLLVLAEAAVFFGFVFPGETAVILGGVVASEGHVNVLLLGGLVVVGAIVGDSIGYAVGHRYGEQILDLKILRHRRGGIDLALGQLRRRGALAVFIGRWTAFLRAVMPGLAGVSRMHYRTFLLANAVGGVVWGVTFTLLGYFIGGAYRRAEKYAGWASTGILIVVLLVAVGLFIRSRRQERQIEEGFESAEDPEATLHEEVLAARRRLEDGEA